MKLDLRTDPLLLFSFICLVLAMMLATFEHLTGERLPGLLDQLAEWLTVAFLIAMPIGFIRASVRKREEKDT
jgi:hypothetical protein